MNKLASEFAGLKLKSPIIAGSCGLTSSVENIKETEKNGAGAVVLKSIFEEEITGKYEKLLREIGTISSFEENLDYYDFKIKQDNINEYISLIKDAKNAVSIPVIASINCVSSHEWTYFAGKIEEAGADALELNIFISPADTNLSGSEKENLYFNIIDKITEKINIPVIVKMSYYFTDLKNMIQKLSETKIKGLVLFNRFFSPDIDIYNHKVIPVNIFSKPEDLPVSMRWIAAASGTAKCDLAASTGVHDGNAAIKQILAGADAVQIASVMYSKGFEIIKKINAEIEKYMDEKKYESINHFRGLMNYKNIKNPGVYDRMQFMKHFSFDNSLKHI